MFLKNSQHHKSLSTSIMEIIFINFIHFLLFDTIVIVYHYCHLLKRLTIYSIYIISLYS